MRGRDHWRRVAQDNSPVPSRLNGISDRDAALAACALRAVAAPFGRSTSSRPSGAHVTAAIGNPRPTRPAQESWRDSVQLVLERFRTVEIYQAMPVTAEPDKYGPLARTHRRLHAIHEAAGGTRDRNANGCLRFFVNAHEHNQLHGFRMRTVLTVRAKIALKFNSHHSQRSNCNY